MVLDQLRQVHLAREDWAALIDLIPVLHKVGKLTPKQEEDLLQQAWRGRLDAASGALETLRPIWRELPRKLRQDRICWPPGDRHLRQLGADNEGRRAVAGCAAQAGLAQLLARLPKLKLELPADADPVAEDQDQPGVDAALAQVYLLAGQLDDAQSLLGRRSQSAERRRLPCLGQVMTSAA